MPKPLVIPADQIIGQLVRDLGIKAKSRRAASFTQDQVRRHSLVVLASIKELSKDQRDRVLQHAYEVNQI